MGAKEGFRPVYWDDGKDCLAVLDQRKLPHSEEWLEICELSELEDAIKGLAIRGAPLLGIAAAYGVYIGIRNYTGDKNGFLKELSVVISRIANTRPTAINLFSSLRRAQEVGRFINQFDIEHIKIKLLGLGDRILGEEEECSRAIARNGADILQTNVRILTHCNTGALAAGGVGTALGIIYEAHRRGYIEEVLVDETRPLLQGARLTTWELLRWGIPFRLLVDGAAPYAMQQKMVDVVIVGADRIVRNGDVANKIGTYSLAVSAHRHRIPFIVAAPTSSFDLSILEGADIPIEQRDDTEITRFAGNDIAPQKTNTFNPAFDITPAELITAIVTERGVIEKPDKYKIADHISGALNADYDALM